MKKPIFIGIAGGTGSGKSTFTNRLKETFGDRVSVVYYDNYYKRRDDLPFEERKKINYDHPDAFETELLILLKSQKHLMFAKNVITVIPMRAYERGFRVDSGR